MTTRRRREPFPDLADEILYPRLDAAKLAWLATLGERRSFAPGEVLYEQGLRDQPFFVIERGLVWGLNFTNGLTYRREVPPGDLEVLVLEGSDYAFFVESPDRRNEITPKVRAVPDDTGHVELRLPTGDDVWVLVVHDPRSYGTATVAQVSLAITPVDASDEPAPCGCAVTSGPVPSVSTCWIAGLVAVAIARRRRRR